MRIELTQQQRESQEGFRAFVQAEIQPNADRYDREERVPPEIIQSMARQGYLGAIIPRAYGGSEMDMITFGLLNEALGRGCSSLRSLLTVHSMVSYAIQRWGSSAQKTYWLPRLAAGETIAAFGLSEPEIGSDAKSIKTSATLDEQGYRLQGHKKWMTYGQIADLFLIFARNGASISTFLVERDTPGFSVSPITGILGTRASMVAELFLEDCRIPAQNLLGGRGFGMASIASSALDVGRYCVAWGSVGIIRACLEDSLNYSSQRQQFGVPLRQHQLIQQMLTEMITNLSAARLLCLQAGYAKEQGDPSTVMQTFIAKYFASVKAAQSANDAVQIHGANGCSSEYSVQRYMRDAKIMEIIEGSTQIQQITIANASYQELGF
ncbi:MAG: acyl-CoA dehydrogenase family protein [Ktedonobacteraceae bacterium]|nr:acyl-CoA dehydrogenase family protein [Ktedonobacteraceae bacterium]